MINTLSRRCCHAVLLCLTFFVVLSGAENRVTESSPVKNVVKLSPPLVEPVRRLPPQYAMRLDELRRKQGLPPAIGWRWAPNTVVKVLFVEGQFNEAEQQALRASINDWNNVAHELGTGVSFLYFGETQAIDGTYRTLTLTRTDPNLTCPGALAYFEPLSGNQAGLITSGVINFNLKTHQPSALVSFMAHEMGHGLGLGDCPRCKETVMRFFRGPNQDNGFFSPTDSDKAIIRSLYAGNNGAISTDATAASAGNR